MKKILFTLLTSMAALSFYALAQGDPKASLERDKQWTIEYVKLLTAQKEAMAALQSFEKAKDAVCKGEGKTLGRTPDLTITCIEVPPPPPSAPQEKK